MAKLKMLQGRIQTQATSRIRPLRTSENRTAGSALQRRRLRAWEASPTCAMCGRVVAYPGGFELDHIIPLWEGGKDEPENCQILCMWMDGAGVKKGCHAGKTALEAVERGG